MNETNHNILKLSDFIEGNNAYGNDDGRDVFQKISKKLDDFSSTKIFGISLLGINRTDASFPRESIISLAKAKRGDVVTIFDIKSSLVGNSGYKIKNASPVSVEIQ